MLLCGVTREDLELIKYFIVNMNEWLKGFHDPAESVRETMGIILRHPLIPKDVACTGYLMDSVTERIEVV